MKTLTVDQQQKKDEAKQRLCEMSAVARSHREKLAEDALNSGNEMKAMLILSTPLNDFIIELFYNPEKIHKFNTFKGWLDEGKCVDKGQKGYVIWGQPIKAEQKNKETKDVESAFKFYPISYIFRDDQVKELTK